MASTATQRGPHVVQPRAPAVPIVATLPHGGRAIPAGFAEALSVAADSLWADWYTNELYDFLPDIGITVVRTDLSRFVADPNRDPASGHGDFWRTVVPLSDPMGAPVYDNPLTPNAVAARVKVAHTPFHQLLDETIATLCDMHGHVMLVDLHSFGVPLESDAVIGDAHSTTASSTVVDRIDDVLLHHGFITARNLRFPGGWIIRRFSADERVDAVAIELNQRLYLDSGEVDSWPDVPGLYPVTLAAARDRLRDAFTRLAGKHSAPSLVLRTPRPSDAGSIASFLDHEDVTRWWPHYDADRITRALLRTEADGVPTWTMERAGVVIGFAHVHLGTTPLRVDVMIGPFPGAVELRERALLLVRRALAASGVPDPGQTNEVERI